MRNTSREAYDLPASVDLTTVNKQGDLGRRDLAIGIDILGPKQSKDRPVKFGAASESSAGSFQRVDAGCSAIVLVKFHFSEILRSVPRASAELSFRMTADEIRYEDREWMTKETTAMVLSKNIETLRIGKP